MALISKASLLMVPSTYEPGKLYNVLPSGNRAPDNKGGAGYDQTRADFDFDRGSNAAATRIGSDGLLKKYRENLLLQSNQFDTTWVLNAVTITDGQPGYDGTNNAWKLQDTAVTGEHFVRQTPSVGNIVSFSVYAKANTLNFLWLRSVEGGVNKRTWFDLSSGSVGTSQGIDANIESVGNGWYRCSATFNHQAAFEYYIAISDANGSSSYTGDGTGSILIQNAQLESGLCSTEYLNSTTTTGKAGVLIDLPRINYDANGENGALLLEPSRQQLIQFSEYFGSYTPLSATITDNVATSPEGLVNAASFIETSASGRHRTNTNSFSVTSGNAYTLSMFAKIASGSRLLCLNAGYLFNARAYFNLASGSVEGTDSGSASIEDYGNGWYRCSITGTSSITGSSVAYFGLEDGASDNGYIGDGTSGHYWYGIQSEAGSYSSSYIPNHSGTGGVTRAADSCSVDYANAHPNDEGTIFFEVGNYDTNTSANGFNKILVLSEAASSNLDNVIYFEEYAGQNTILIRKGGSTILQSNPGYQDLRGSKIAIKWNSSEAKIFIDGVLNKTYTGDASLSPRYIGYDNPYNGQIVSSLAIKQQYHFNEALSDSELATLTTL